MGQTVGSDEAGEDAHDECETEDEGRAAELHFDGEAGRAGGEGVEEDGDDEAWDEAEDREA